MATRAAVRLSEGAAGSTSFADYEQPASYWQMQDDARAVGLSYLRLTKRLAYLEAGSTNTECWVVNSLNRCHVQQWKTSAVEVWRLLAGKRIVVAFRGTCDFGDVLTDIAAVS